MSTIQPHMSGEVLPAWPPGSRLARQTGHALAQIEAGTTVGVARIEAAAELQAMKASAVAHVGRRGMQEIALLSQVETQLAQAVPHASGRLASIADLTAVAVSEVVLESARRIGRCG